MSIRVEVVVCCCFLLLYRSECGHKNLRIVNDDFSPSGCKIQRRSCVAEPLRNDYLRARSSTATWVLTPVWSIALSSAGTPFMAATRAVLLLVIVDCSGLR